MQKAKAGEGLSSEFGLRSKELIDNLLVLLLSDLSLELEGGGQLTAWDREVVHQHSELTDVGGARHRLFVGLLDALFEELVDLGVGGGLLRGLQVQAQLALEEVHSFGSQVS